MSLISTLVEDLQRKLCAHEADFRSRKFLLTAYLLYITVSFSKTRLFTYRYRRANFRNQIFVILYNSSSMYFIKNNSTSQTCTIVNLQNYYKKLQIGYFDHSRNYGINKKKYAKCKSHWISIAKNEKHPPLTYIF